MHDLMIRRKKFTAVAALAALTIIQAHENPFFGLFPVPSVPTMASTMMFPPAVPSSLMATAVAVMILMKQWSTRRWRRGRIHAVDCVDKQE